MKKLSIFFVLSAFISSCSLNNELSHSSVHGEWELVQMQGSVYDPDAEEPPLLYQETYRFNSDGSFIKTRIRDGEQREASGTFIVSEYESGYNPDGYLNLITLTYPSENDLIVNCSAAAKEQLILTADHRLIGTARACDYPSVVYEKQNI